ncbi:MAG: single-stranded DNA-binding protein [Coprobacillus sp.]
MLNKIILEGRISKDLEVRRTQNGTAVVNFDLCVERLRKTEDKKVDYIKCVVWNKVAESLVKYCQKGSLISLVGRLQTKDYDNAEGKKVNVTEVFCEEIHYLNTGKKNGNQANNQEELNKQDFEVAQNNFDISEEDIQF